MTTITAVQLRNNLDDIANRASAGERIRVSYRNKLTFTIGPDIDASTSNTVAVLKKLKEVHSTMPQSVRDKYASDRAFKDLIAGYRAEKYGKG